MSTGKPKEVYGIFHVSKTEFSARERARFDNNMKWRTRRYGYPCLTQQECRAVELSLFGLPEDELPTSERVTQQYVANQMRVSQPRVSKLLTNAAKAMLWLESHDCEVGWVRRPGKRGVAKWQFRAPVERNGDKDTVK